MTERKYAHEVYPQAAEYEVRPLAVEVPCLYARALGLATYSLDHSDLGKIVERINYMIASREIAFLADALLQGLTSDKAWEWAQQRADDETGEWVWERARHYGVDPEAIKAYPLREVAGDRVQPSQTAEESSHE
jgi:hypothetical protein